MTTIVCLVSASAHAETSAVAVDAEPGRWDVRTELLYDPASKSLVRREVRVWDQHPSAHLVFAFAPDASNPFAGGPASGVGRLTWRPEATPAYDPSAVLIDYKGALSNGRPEGLGTERDADGLVYDGRWKDGRPHGAGHLRTSAGADYRGQFLNGKAEGLGTFTDIDGETYVGVFHAGLREGLATTTLPNQVSYRSIWHGGVEVAASRKLRLAQLGKGAASPEQDIRIGITVLGHPPDDSVLGYKGESQGRVLRIVPDKEGLMRHWKGTGPIRPSLYNNVPFSVGMFAFTEQNLLPVRLTMTVQNQGPEMVQIVGASVKVDASGLDNEPAIQLLAAGDASCSQNSAYTPFFHVQNFGISAVGDPVMKFAFSGKSASAPVPFDRSKDLGTFQKTKDVNFERDLADAGVKTETLKAAAKKQLRCRSAEPKACLAEVRKGGLFGRLSQNIFLDGDSYVSVGIKGSLDYDWQTSAGKSEHRRSSLATRIVLAQLPVTAECGEGGEAMPIAENPVELRLEGRDYRLPIKFRDAVRPGRMARYNFSLHAAKSSDHRLAIAVQLADGREIVSRPIDLTYFVPVQP